MERARTARATLESRGEPDNTGTTHSGRDKPVAGYRQRQQQQHATAAPTLSAVGRRVASGTRHGYPMTLTYPFRWRPGLGMPMMRAMTDPFPPLPEHPPIEPQQVAGVSGDGPVGNGPGRGRVAPDLGCR